MRLYGSDGPVGDEPAADRRKPVEGEFEKDDIVRIVAPNGEPIGVGRVACSSARARQTMGQKGGRPVVHYDYLYLD